LKTLGPSRNRKGSFILIGDQESWSLDLSRSRTTTYSSEGSINRYYDPSTDQFLSVDPDVQTTDEPYAFVNDDPLNATDPLGLGAQANEALTASLSELAVRQKAFTEDPTSANKAALNALKNRVETYADLVNKEDAQAVVAATSSGTTEVPSVVASAESQQRAAYACEARATGIIVKGGITGSVIAGAGGTTDALAVFGIEVAPELTGIVLIGAGIAVIVGSIVAGGYQESEC
jgi:hypothetical protein